VRAIQRGAIEAHKGRAGRPRERWEITQTCVMCWLFSCLYCLFFSI